MLQAGTVVAEHLRLVRQLGSGGMGSVWVAEHLRVGGQVAVKFLSTALLDHENARSRFAREAKWAAKIRSPHVVQVHDHGVMPGATPVPYIVMELLEGSDLSDVLEREGPLELSRCTEILEQVCEALAKAHEAGVVHRDIKPENVFLLSQPKTFVKLLDFGVAHGDDGQIDRLTQTGLLLGTAFYMSPEQLFCGKDVDRRADLWALGVLTYQLLTNRLPFHADTFGQLCLKVKDGVFPKLNDTVHVPPGIEQWFARALCTDREGRFQSAAEMYQAFERAAAEARPSARPLFRGANRPVVSARSWAVAGAVVVALAVTFAFLLSPDGDRPTPDRHSVEALAVAAPAPVQLESRLAATSAAGDGESGDGVGVSEPGLQSGLTPPEMQFDEANSASVAQQKQVLPTDGSSGAKRSAPADPITPVAMPDVLSPSKAPAHVPRATPSPPKNKYRGF